MRQTLASVAKGQIVDQGRSEDGSVRGRDALAVIQNLRGGLLAGKLRQGIGLVLVEVRESTANRESVLGGAIEDEVHLAHVGATVQFIWSVKSEACEV